MEDLKHHGTLPMRTTFNLLSGLVGNDQQSLVSIYAHDPGFRPQPLRARRVPRALLRHRIVFSNATPPLPLDGTTTWHASIQVRQRWLVASRWRVYEVPFRMTLRLEGSILKDGRIHPKVREHRCILHTDKL